MKTTEGIEGVILELGLISCGFNLHKYHLKKMAAQEAAWQKVSKTLQKKQVFLEVWLVCQFWPQIYPQV